MTTNVGGQANTATINNALTSISVGMRNIMQQAANLSTWINGQGTGLATLQALGYSNTANASNPGGISDAQYALNMIGYLNTVSQLWFGSATQPTAFNFNNELSQMWAGQ